MAPQTCCPVKMQEVIVPSSSNFHSYEIDNVLKCIRCIDVVICDHSLSPQFVRFRVRSCKDYQILGHWHDLVFYFKFDSTILGVQYLILLTNTLLCGRASSKCVLGANHGSPACGSAVHLYVGRDLEREPMLGHLQYKILTGNMDQLFRAWEAACVSPRSSHGIITDCLMR